MADFERAIPIVLGHEGGYVNNPSDPGGETNHGISAATLCRIYGCDSIAPGTVRRLTEDQAKAIYREYYWTPLGLDAVADQLLATKLLDVAVNAGPDRAVKLAQRALNKLGASLVVDGELGPLTMHALVHADAAALVEELCAQQLQFYRRLAVAKPRLAVFLRGWEQRAAWPKEA